MLEKIEMPGFWGVKNTTDVEKGPSCQNSKFQTFLYHPLVFVNFSVPKNSDKIWLTTLRKKVFLVRQISLRFITVIK